MWEGNYRPPDVQWAHVICNRANTLSVFEKSQESNLTKNERRETYRLAAIHNHVHLLTLQRIQRLHMDKAIQIRDGDSIYTSVVTRRCLSAT
jgi:hypothetical protein